MNLEHMVEHWYEKEYGITEIEEMNLNHNCTMLIIENGYLIHEYPSSAGCMKKVIYEIKKDEISCELVVLTKSTSSLAEPSELEYRVDEEFCNIENVDLDALGIKHS